MAITYKWDIPQMNAYVQAEGEDNVIYTVYYRYTGSEFVDDGSGSTPPVGKTYTSTNIGEQSYVYVAGDPFVPYADTEAFEAVVIGWLEGSLDMPAIQASIAAVIAKEITKETPPASEGLYFTWMNPVPPPPPPPPTPPPAPQPEPWTPEKD